MIDLRAAALVCSVAYATAACGLARPQVTERATQDAARELADRLTVPFGCEETFVVRDDESTVVLAVTVPGLLERARGVDLPYEKELEVGSAEIIVRLEQGADLDHWCTDVMARPPRIDTVWIGISGKATVVLIERRPESASGGGDARPVPTRARLKLGPTVLAREDLADETVRLPGLEIEATLGVPGGG